MAISLHNHLSLILLIKLMLVSVGESKENWGNPVILGFSFFLSIHAPKTKIASNINEIDFICWLVISFELQQK